MTVNFKPNVLSTCPTCRYELPVDDQEYERERKRRMADRKVDEQNLQNEPESKSRKTEEASPQDSQPKQEEKHKCALAPLHGDRTCCLLEEESYCSCACGHTFHEECLQSYLRVCGSIKPEETIGQAKNF